MSRAASGETGATGGGRDSTSAADPAPERGPERPAKPYSRPRLEDYGRLCEVTGFGGSTVLDSGSGNLGNQPLAPP